MCTAIPQQSKFSFIIAVVLIKYSVTLSDKVINGCDKRSEIMKAVIGMLLTLMEVKIIAF